MRLLRVLDAGLVRGRPRAGEDVTDDDVCARRGQGLQPRAGVRSLRGCYVVGGLIYGLVNVRTDGKKILCAVRNEKNLTWDVGAFQARFGAS